MHQLILISIISILICVLIGRFLSKTNLPESLIDKPNTRKIHTTPTPLVGGIAIIFSLLIIIIIFNLYSDSSVQLFIIYSLYFFFVGLFDDLFQWNYKKKLILQILGTIAFTITISKNIEIIYFCTIYSTNPIVINILIFMWLIFIINAFNFFDGINFLGGSLAIVFFTSYVIFFQAAGDLIAIMLLIILIFSIIGFLFYNRTPAKMFLGDAGSMFLGFTIAAFPLIFLISDTQFHITFFVISVFILISDTTFVIITRLVQKRNPFRPDRTHLHHQLLNLNFRNRYVVLIILTGSIMHSILAYFSNGISLEIILSLLIFINVIFILLPRYLPFLIRRYDLWGLKKIFDNTINLLQGKNKYE
jgi:UDP-GlcNAc:undecaprenyl-phosphate GlcNAc-1-phosphate transferase